ncbi:DinB family protein [Paenibacillus guangzhouensis]|uniref:DinB family protein n=1 Tax=Paenibacillus guangzhouensis TaxID=1473112 RepID=UPI001266CB71|nr:DinB family protein [Paenibacillus guangzhouensis]
MKNIILIGMPTAGKSTLGVILAKIKGYEFVDSDLVIQKKENRLLKEIIAHEGIDGFISIENRVIASLCVDHSIIATGGSVLYGNDAMKHLKEIGTVIYLKLNYETIQARLENAKQRGVVIRDHQSLRQLYEERCPIYEKYADMIIDAESLGIEELVDQINERMYAMELQEINQKLIDTRDELLGILNGLSGDQLNRRKDSTSWSIGQVCQHLSKTEELYVYAIKKGLKSNEDSIIDKKPLEFLLDRSKKLEAPDIAKPMDEMFEHQEIINKLKNSREKLFELLNTLDDPSLLSRRHFVHPVFKEMLLIEWVKSLYMHEQRHIEQIIEIKGLNL